ncbi:hypothetical protein N431DRAFT_463176 [Stipitochalara longipes BDJ]|nr:hypothetical protein N431DRAFT_463176 [Stipitochalara longipes BDJ]
MGSLLSLICNQQPHTLSPSDYNHPSVPNPSADLPNQQPPPANIAAFSSGASAPIQRLDLQSTLNARTEDFALESDLPPAFLAFPQETSHRLGRGCPGDLPNFREQHAVVARRADRVLLHNVFQHELEQHFGLTAGTDFARALMHLNMEIEPNGWDNEGGELLYDVYVYGVLNRDLRRPYERNQHALFYRKQSIESDYLPRETIQTYNRIFLSNSLQVSSLPTRQQGTLSQPAGNAAPIPATLQHLNLQASSQSTTRTPSLNGVNHSRLSRYSHLNLPEKPLRRGERVLFPEIKDCIACLEPTSLMTFHL